MNNVNVDIFKCLGRRKLDDEMKSIFKIDFNTNTKIVLAVLKRFRSHKYHFRGPSIKHGSQSTVTLLNTKNDMNTKSHVIWEHVNTKSHVITCEFLAVVDRKVLISKELAGSTPIAKMMSSLEHKEIPLR